MKITNEIHTHFCNDNRRDGRGETDGSPFWHGRFWLHFFASVFRLTWAFGRQASVTNVGLWFDFVFEKEAGFTIALKRVFYLGFAVHSPRFPSWSYKHGNRSIELRIFNWGVWLDFWRDDDMPFTKRRVIIKPLDILFGREKHTQKHISLQDVIVPMPEKDYPATVELYVSEWRRPRSPLVRRIDRANIELEKPIPTPGKGENSWDLGEDATYGLTCRASTPDAAVQRLIASVMRDREKYGGEGWMPSSE